MGGGELRVGPPPDRGPGSGVRFHRPPPGEPTRPSPSPETAEPGGAESAALRAELKALHEKGLRGDIPRRQLDRTLAEKTVALYRAAVRERLAAGERIVAEHHAVLGHMRLAESVLREPEEEAVSLFATDRRLLRVRALLGRDRPTSCDAADGTEIDELPLEAIGALVMRHQARWGEVLVGLIIVVLAFAFKAWLLVTGTILIVLGALGVVHSLLLPTRWIEIRAHASGPNEPWRILAVRKKSARALRRLLMGELRKRSPLGAP